MQNRSPDNDTLIAELVRDFINEKRSNKRWKNFRFFMWFLLVAIVAFLVIIQVGTSNQYETEKGYVSLVRLSGAIGPDENFSAENVLPLLKSAFADSGAKGVVLDINSGGGTPVQAAIIHDAIIELKNKYHKKVIVVGEDMMASGAYYVAVAADKIYVNPSTLTGSVGVIMKSFGFPDLIKKVGIERRVYASGLNKDRLDPFLPTNPEDVAKIRQVIGEIHGNFQNVVIEGRKGKLHGDPAQLFSGDFWSGDTALKLGLVDALGNLSNVVHDEFHVSGYKDYSQSPSLMKNLMGQFGASMSMMLGNNRMQVLERI